MSLTPSTMLELKTKAPDFKLPDVVSGKTLSLNSFAGKKALLVMFISRHCPYVIHIKKELARLGKDYASQDIGILAICSNDVSTHPDDAPDQLKAMAKEEGFTFPFAYDESQSVAKAYTAACTPDIFLFNKDRKLVYRGQLDESRPGNGKPVTGRDLRAAIDAVLADKARQRRAKSPASAATLSGNPATNPATSGKFLQFHLFSRDRSRECPGQLGPKV